MLTLFGLAGSGSAAVEMALERCAVPHRVLRASSRELRSAQVELRRANPLGQIPTLQLEDGSVLTESAAILVHLGPIHPASNLLPAASGDRAQAVRGPVYIAASCYAAIGVIDSPERWCAQGDAAQLGSIRQGARRRLHECWSVFVDQCGTQLSRPGAEAGALDLPRSCRVALVGRSGPSGRTAARAGRHFGTHPTPPEYRAGVGAALAHLK